MEAHKKSLTEITGGDHFKRKYMDLQKSSDDGMKLQNQLRQRMQEYKSHGKYQSVKLQLPDIEYKQALSKDNRKLFLKLIDIQNRK